MKINPQINFKILHKKRPPGYSMPSSHTHSYYEIGYFIAGSRKIFINHTVYELQPGYLAIIRKNEIHRAIAVGNQGTNSIALTFSEHYLEALYKRYGKEFIEDIFDKHIFCFNPRQKRNIEKLLHSMVIDYKSPDEFTPHMQELFIEELFIHLMRAMQNQKQVANIYKEDEIKRMEEAAHYISTHFNEDLSLKLIATKYNVSTSYFSKKFKSVTGFSFKEYLIAVRIKEACGLLIQTNISITEIATRCGFTDSNYFGDAFKKIKGISPRDFRRVSGFI
ncbi:MAG: AraC family transcriptional regulator [Candidatus Cellulosilyticum pullistercoris]|uniref:AraC family transcriptional regulator n=1 Tax=Candidatus Cellulosilyticum pullistercoris TaxID=2838521 RepID=A0A9E2KAK7_9FIRM|nr:AraC family transcriptional regulator [Candidatus Cellulosilyticum pullistercoris]